MLGSPSYPQSLLSILKSGFSLFTANLVPLVVLTLMLCLPLALAHQFGSPGLLLMVYIVTIRLIEAAVALGVVSFLFYRTIPVFAILKFLIGLPALGVLHIAMLEFFLILITTSGLFIPSMVSILFLGLYIMLQVSFCLSRHVFIFQRHRGFFALLSSHSLVRLNIVRTLALLMVLVGIKFLVLQGVLSSMEFQHSLDNMTELNEELMMQFISERLWPFFLTYLALEPFMAVCMSLLYVDLLKVSGLPAQQILQGALVPLFGLPTNTSGQQEATEESKPKAPESDAPLADSDDPNEPDDPKKLN